MRNTTFVLFLLICVAALHTDASQEAQLREFIQYRRSNAYSVDDLRILLTATSRILRAEYSVSDQPKLKAADKITALLGQPVVDFSQYGGYVTVDEKNGRALFYYFVEAATDPAAKPLLLWLNGGPGCSSIGYGAMMELGPFRVNSNNETLNRNMQAWNNVANVIFLESSAGVGFSYSNKTSDYNSCGDQRTADDTFVFLVNWLERFPEYKGRAFYISGESYGGHCVPQLAATVLRHTMNNVTRTPVNLQGILVGNPFLDDDMNAKGRVDCLWSRGVISDESRTNTTKNSKFNGSDGDACHDAALHYPADTDPHDIYRPVCIESSNGTFYPSSYIPGYDPCSNHHVQAYLNDPKVQKALHARETVWSHCTSLRLEKLQGPMVQKDLYAKVSKSTLLGWKDVPVSMVPTLKWLMEHKLPVWLFRVYKLPPLFIIAAGFQARPIFVVMLIVQFTAAAAKRDLPIADGPLPQSTGGGALKSELVYVGVGFGVAMVVVLGLFYLLHRRAVARAPPTNPPPPGADEAAISALKTNVFTAPPEEGTKECEICLEEYTEGDPLMVLPCDHFFHQQCARKVLLVKGNCPVCRREV